MSDRPDVSESLTRPELDAIAADEGIEDPSRFGNKAEIIAAIQTNRGEAPPVDLDPITVAPYLTIEYTDPAGDQQTIESGASGEVRPRNQLEADILAAHATGPAAKAEADAAEGDE